MLKRERRTVTIQGLTVEARAGRDGEEAAPVIRGHAALFDTLSEDLGGFREKIAPGAFSKSLGADVRALFNHDPNLILGRTRAKTLRLAEDGQGLAIEIDPPDTEMARGVMEAIRRGDVSQMSFGFFTRADKWEEKDGETTRTLLEVDLFDVSPVTFPAYPDTEVAVRSMTEWSKAERRGRTLASLLSELIDTKVTDDRSRSDIIEAMGAAAGISAGTVNQILNAEINCPPLQRLRGFARILDVALNRLRTAAEQDGCEYDSEENSVRCALAKVRQRQVEAET